MNKKIYDALSEKEKLFADLLERMVRATERMSTDIERMQRSLDD